MGVATAQKVLAPELAALEAAGESPAVLEALDCLRIAITLYDADERLVYANQHFDYLFRNLPKRTLLLGERYGDIVRHEIAGGEIADAALFIGGADAFVQKRRQHLTSGDFRPLDVSLADGRIIEIKARRTKTGGWIALWSDVTQARHLMTRLEDAIELSADAFAFFDKNDRMVVCNGEYAHLMGKRIDQLQGQMFRKIVEDAVARDRVKVDGDKPAWIARWLDLHHSPAGAMTLETPDGRAFLVRDRRTRDGGRVIVLTDVTDERRVEAALAEQSRALEKTKAELATSESEAEQRETYLADLTKRLDAVADSADSTKKTLLRTMSHELKTPLNAIIGFSDLLNQMSDRFGPEEVREYAGLIHLGGQTLLRIISNILDLTKIAAGKYELHRQPTDVSGALWIAKDKFAARAAAKNVTIDADACPVGLMADVDQNAFGQMIHQLLENAVAFCAHNGAVTLSAFGQDGRVFLSVADDGPGVAAEHMDRILEPFEQVGRSTTDHAHGAGLGLTLVKAFAELHGGVLSISSRPGEGFTAT
ncbi:MAG: PAS-domain containing protein, partial [Alphaproteobacteria bacterium]|nr:PAS-domain containing protein [Alphaproteobacteria bacterium]